MSKDLSAAQSIAIGVMIAIAAGFVNWVTVRLICP